MQRKQMEKHADKTGTAQILNCQQFSQPFLPIQTDRS